MKFFNSLFGDSGKQKQPIEQLVLDSVKNLEKYKSNLTTADLEAEAIYLAAYIYLKNDYRIDFKIDYVSEEMLDAIESENYEIADKVFDYMRQYFPEKYGQVQHSHGINGYKMNIQLASDYGSYVKNYFIRAHKIEEGKKYLHFSSPRNCLWNNEILNFESPTQRDIYYNISDSVFELMIPPYNPLVTGKVIEKSDNKIKCQSNDKTRTFVFHYENEINSLNLNYIEMFRNDKGDMVSYHKK